MTALPGPLAHAGAPFPGAAAERFDALVLTCIRPLEQRWAGVWGRVEFAVEHAPLLPAGWTGSVPLATLVRSDEADHGGPHRIVLFRRPIQDRVAGRVELAALVSQLLVQHVAELLGMDPDDVDPGLAGPG